MKSAVKQMASSSETFSAAASSSVSGPTSSLGSTAGIRPARAFTRSPGPSLAAHPAASTNCVSRIGSLTILPSLVLACIALFLAGCARALAHIMSHISAYEDRAIASIARMAVSISSTVLPHPGESRTQPLGKVRRCLCAWGHTAGLGGNISHAHAPNAGPTHPASASPRPVRRTARCDRRASGSHRGNPAQPLQQRLAESLFMRPEQPAAVQSPQGGAALPGRGCSTCPPRSGQVETRDAVRLAAASPVPPSINGLTSRSADR